MLAKPFNLKLIPGGSILEGECTQCGLCCFSSNGTDHCEHLRQSIPCKAPGEPAATFCQIYSTRIPWQVVHSIDGKTGQHRKLERCQNHAANMELDIDLWLPEDCPIHVKEKKDETEVLGTTG
jgi:hypothetical protein